MTKTQRHILTGLLTLVLTFSIAYIARAEALQQAPPLPTDGWRVCQDLGIGSVPGLGEDRQRFVLCNPPTGWQVQAYCLNPGVTPPSVGAYCSMVSDSTFWCGDGIQQLEFYGILQLPPTPTSTFTATATSTATTTSIPPTFTPGPSQTAPAATRAPTTAATPVVRVAPGGPGNREWIVAGAVLLSSLLAGVAWLIHRKILSR